MRRLRPSRTTWRLPVLVVLASLAFLVAVPGRPAAQVAGFGASSSAFGARVSITIAKAPLLPNLVDLGGPLAQTRLDSLGTTEALASFPYPGDVVLNLPGLAAGLGPQLPGLVSGLPGVAAGAVPGIPSELFDLLSQVEIPEELVAPLLTSAPPLPPYPFAAKADALTPDAAVDLGVGTLTASAAPTRVSAVASSEPGASGALLAPLDARSMISQAEDGTLVAEATGSVTGLRLGPLVIGAVTSTARMERTADGEVRPTSSFRVSGITVGALSLDLTEEGFTIGGTAVPAPIAATVNGALAAAGLELRLLPEVVTDSAVVAGGLELIRHQSFGPLGDGTISIVFGQSSATLNDAVLLPVAPAPPAAPSSSPAGPDPVVAAPTPSGPAGAAVSRAPAPGPAGSVVEASRTAAAEPFDAAGIYLLLIAAAAVIVGIGPLLRLRPFAALTTR